MSLPEARGVDAPPGRLPDPTGALRRPLPSTGVPHDRGTPGWECFMGNTRPILPKHTTLFLRKEEYRMWGSRSLSGENKYSDHKQKTYGEEPGPLRRTTRDDRVPGDLTPPENTPTPSSSKRQVRGPTLFRALVPTEGPTGDTRHSLLGLTVRVDSLSDGPFPTSPLVV